MVRWASENGATTQRERVRGETAEKKEGVRWESAESDAGPGHTLSPCYCDEGAGDPATGLAGGNQGVLVHLPVCACACGCVRDDLLLFPTGVLGDAGASTCDDGAGADACTSGDTSVGAAAAEGAVAAPPAAPPAAPAPEAEEEAAEPSVAEAGLGRIFTAPCFNGAERSTNRGEWSSASAPPPLPPPPPPRESRECRLSCPRALPCP